MAFPTGWTGKKKITIDNTKVSGSSNLTNFPVLIKDSNIPTAVYSSLLIGSHSLDLELSSSQFAKIADGSQTGLDLSTDFSAEAWIKLEQLPSTAGTQFAIVTKYESGANNRSWQFLIDATDYLRVQWSSDGTSGSGSNSNFYATTAFTSADVGKWIHVAVAADISVPSATFYINGIAQTTTTTFANATTIYNGGASVVIGAREATLSTLTYDNYFDGKIKNVRVWSDIRTATEVYQNMYFETPASTTNLVANWLFNNNYEDQTANNNDLTATGSPVFSSTDMPSAINQIRFSSDLSGTTEIPFEVVSLDSVNETAEIWVKVPTVYYNTDTVFYIWYGNASATPYAANDTYGSQNVWTNYKAVYHFNSLVSDSSASARTLTNNGGILQDTSSKLGSGTNYGASNSSKYFTNTTMPATGSTGFTIQFWIKTSQTTNGNVYSVGWDNGSARSFQFILNSVNANKIRAYWSGGLYALYSSTTINDGNWHRITYTYAGGSSGAMALYVDGSLEDSTTGTGGLSDQSTGTAEFIGRRSASAIDYFSGYTDDLRTIYGGTNPSADWIATEYANQNSPSTFLSLSDPIITTSVTKDLGYAILTEGLLQKDTDYKVLPTYSLTKSSDYTIINTIAAITKQADYAIKTILGITKDTDYYVKPTYSITKTAQYGVLRTIAAITKGLEYSILPPSVVLLGLDYLILLSMGITKDMAYRITLTNSLTKQFAYAVLTSTSITKTLDYYILLGSVIQKDLAYYVLSNPSLEKQLDYAIKTYSSIQKSLDYIIGITTAITKDSTYKVYATFEITKGMRYAIGVGGYIYNYTSRGTEYNEDYQYTERGNSYTDQYN